TGALLEINALDLRSGGASHLRSAHQDWLIDAGPARDYDRVLLPYLRSRGVNRLDGVIFTHGGAGHLGGAGGVLADFRPRQLIDTAAQDRSPLHRKFIDLLAKEKRNRRVCQPGDEFKLSAEITARVLFPPAVFEGDHADDQALVLQVIVSGKPWALLMSDSGVATERVLLRNYPDLRSDILIKGQHHSGESGSPDFLDRVQPQVIVATSRDFPDSERLKPEWIDDVRSRGIKLFRQDETGAVRIRLFRDGWEARAYVTGESFRSSRR
ncbi:MAG TPA: MBL fold metallo-hydrolase, partial [Chthoniobacterales bacterium]